MGRDFESDAARVRSRLWRARLQAVPFALRELVRYARAFVLREPDRREAALEFARRNARPGDPNGVLAALDRFAREDRFLMNVGPEKGTLLEEELRRIGPEARVLELGSFVGYSAILMARMLSDRGRIVSIDVSPEASEVSRAMAELAGVSKRVEFLTGSANERLDGIDERFDLVFLDHWKDLYKPDTEKILARGLLAEGAVIVADNLGPMFGENPYLEWMQARSDFESHYVEGHVEYQQIEDGALVSRWRGRA
jgi:catechol O-methyltransferase